MPLPEKALIAQFAAWRRRDQDRNGGRRVIRKSVALPASGTTAPSYGSRQRRTRLVTTDFSLEGIHFRRDWHPPESVGHRCLAQGTQRHRRHGWRAGRSLPHRWRLPRDLPQAWVARFARSLIVWPNDRCHPCRRRHGGNRPNGILADIIVLGAVPKGTGHAAVRARAGDRIFVSGELGGSAAAVQQMTKREEGDGTRLSPPLLS